MFPFPWLSSRRDSLISVLLKLAFTWITPFVILRALFRKLKRAFLRKLIGTFLREPIFGIALLIFDGHLYLWKEIESSRYDSKMVKKLIDGPQKVEERG